MMTSILKTGKEPETYPYLGISTKGLLIVLFVGINEGVYVWTSDDYLGDIQVGDHRDQLDEGRFKKLPSDKYVELRN